MENHEIYDLYSKEVLDSCDPVGLAVTLAGRYNCPRKILPPPEETNIICWFFFSGLLIFSPVSCFSQIFAAAAVVAATGSAVYAPVVHGPVTTQYHSQDELGQYSYGYSGGPSAKHEQRTADGVTSGGYSYVDANGLVQSLAYVSDPVNGFRVSGTNLPVDSNTPVVHAAAPVVHAAVPTVVEARHHYAAAAPYAALPAPYVVAAAPSYVAAPAPVVHHPLVKLAQPLTPAGTSNLHYPEHAVLLARRKRSAGLYPYHPLVASGYAVHAAPAPPAHIVSVKHYEVAAAPAVHHLAPAPLIAAPAPVATSYTSVVRHDSPAAAAVAVVAAPAPHVYAAPAPLEHHVYAAAPAPHVYAAAPAPAPYVYAAAPAAVAVAPVKTQFHAQDEHGQYTYGYTDGASAKTESRTADGETHGSYSYVDDAGSVQAVHYTAGAEGFKAAGTNIPVHHV